VDARRAQRRAQLLDAADRVIRREGPAASMDDIAAEAGVTKPILYRHFGDKWGLYHMLWARYVDALVTKLREALTTAPDPRTRLLVTIETYLAFIEEEREAYRFLMHRAIREHPSAQEAVADFIRRVAGEVSIVVREELGRLGLDTGGAEPWAYGVVGMVHLAGDWWLESRSMSRRQLVDYLVALLWEGFARLEPAAPIPPAHGLRAPRRRPGRTSRARR
jgi:AcrR family transcriptional regulator